MDKREWRARATAERVGRSIDSNAHCRAIASFLAERLERHLLVVTFDAMPGEVDLGPLLSAEPDAGSRFAITRTPDQGFELSVHPVGCTLERHRYGYLQPMASAPVVDDDRIGAVLVPGLAFDRSGVRLGRGKGYYDRFLARFDHVDHPAALIGVTGDYVVDSLPSESFDVAMTHLATSDGVFPVPLSSAPS